MMIRRDGSLLRECRRKDSDFGRYDVACEACRIERARRSQELRRDARRTTRLVVAGSDVADKRDLYISTLWKLERD